MARIALWNGKTFVTCTKFWKLDYEIIIIYRFGGTRIGRFLLL